MVAGTELTTVSTESETGNAWGEYLDTRSERAFAAVVRKHLDLVYSVALRRCAGDAALAQDVTQQVFADLAGKASRLPRQVVLAGWLYRHSTFVASTFIRTETRRRQREQTAMQLHDPTGSVDWTQVAPVLEDAMNELPERDRNAIVLRFLEHRTFAEVGGALGVGADAARMRVDRALDRLREHLSRRGITSTTVALALGIGHHGVVAAPAGLAASVAASALLTSATLAPTTALIGFMTATKIQLGVAALVAVAATTGAYLQHRTNQALRAELEALRAASRVQASTPDRADGPSPAEIEALRQDRLRLMALRDEVGRLREAQRLVAKLEQENQALRESRAEGKEASEEEKPRDYEAEMEMGLALARMNFTKAWTIAFIQHAAANDNRLPASFEEAAPFFQSDPSESAAVLDPNRFEIMYRGSLQDITNPAATILIREREPFTRTSKDGQKVLLRTYSFADGHSEIHAANNGDFENWERPRLMPSPPARE